jgi:trans-aconitate methyltransferase
MSHDPFGKHKSIVIWVIEDQITILRPYNARYTGDPRSVFRKRYAEMITRVSLDRSLVLRDG